MQWLDLPYTSKAEIAIACAYYLHSRGTKLSLLVFYWVLAGSKLHHLNLPHSNCHLNFGSELVGPNHDPRPLYQLTNIWLLGRNHERTNPLIVISTTQGIHWLTWLLIERTARSHELVPKQHGSFMKIYPALHLCIYYLCYFKVFRQKLLLVCYQAYRSVPRKETVHVNWNNLKLKSILASGMLDGLMHVITRMSVYFWDCVRIHQATCYKVILLQKRWFCYPQLPHR